jgi:hypothetical protein
MFLLRRSMAMVIIFSFFLILLHWFSFSSRLNVFHLSAESVPFSRASLTAQPGSL